MRAGTSMLMLMRIDRGGGSGWVVHIIVGWNAVAPLIMTDNQLLEYASSTNIYENIHQQHTCSFGTNIF